MRESVKVFTTKVAVAFALMLGQSGAMAEVGKSDPAPSPKPASPIVISGQAKIVDADTIDIAERRIRLEGIDAPERGQRCPTAATSSETWKCGRMAAKALKDLIAGHPIRCLGLTLDGHRRLIATCFVGKKNISAWLVRNGHAWAFIKYSQRYKAEETRARKEQIGLWANGATPLAPWVFRARRWDTAEQTAPEGCPIKGNVSTRGRIYHTPWSRWYRKVRISPERGERWFCTEAEALAAGWRAAKTR